VRAPISPPPPPLLAERGEAEGERKASREITPGSRGDGHLGEVAAAARRVGGVEVERWKRKKTTTDHSRPPVAECCLQ
jgi:hypothetical protein